VGSPIRRSRRQREKGGRHPTLSEKKKKKMKKKTKKKKSSKNGMQERGGSGSERKEANDVKNFRRIERVAHPVFMLKKKRARSEKRRSRGINGKKKRNPTLVSNIDRDWGGGN